MADPADLVRDACVLLAGYMDVLERLVAEPSSSPGGAAGMTPRAAEVPEPWNAPAGRALMDGHEGSRRLEAALRYALNGHPGQRRGASAGNTAAALAAIPRLAAGLPEDAGGEAVRILERWITSARLVPAIDEAQRWRPLPSRACPFCGCFFLKVLLNERGQPAARVECFGHMPSGEPCRATWGRVVDIVPDLERADGLAGTCIQPCDPDCEAGPEHCYWIHEPNHKPGWHSQDDCPERVADETVPDLEGR